MRWQWVDLKEWGGCELHEDVLTDAPAILLRVVRHYTSGTVYATWRMEDGGQLLRVAETGAC